MRTPLIIIVSVFLCCSDDSSSLPQPVADVENEIADHIAEVAIPVSNSPLDMPDEVLSEIESFKSAKIVGLGEATHGTKEFFQMKHRIFQYLVENEGFDAFLFEMDLAEARIFNDWVQWKSSDDITTLMADNMIFWTWHTEEVRDLLRWMRQYNNGRSQDDMIGFYGVDSQSARFNVDQLANIIREVNPQVADSVLLLNQNLSDIYNLYTDNYSDDLLAEFTTGIQYAKEAVQRLRMDIIDEMGENEFLWAERLQDHMRQVHQVVYDQIRNNRYYQRDANMAENTIWYFDLLGEDARLVLWAHNAHVADDPQFGGQFGGSQGAYLKDRFADEYVIMGFSFCGGTLTAVESGVGLKTHTLPSLPDNNSFNHVLCDDVLTSFIMPTKQTGQSDLDGWLDQSLPFLMIGAVYDGSVGQYFGSINLSEHYDYLIHYETTNYAVQLPR